MAIPQTYKVKGLIKDQLEKEGRRSVDWILYDSNYTKANETQTIRFFQNTIGSSGQYRTNMKTQGMLNAPQSMVVKELGCFALNTDGKPFIVTANSASAIALNALFSKLYFDFRIEPQSMYEGAGFEFYNAVNTVRDGATTSLGTNVFPVTQNFKTIKLMQPIIIAPNRNFSVNITLTAPVEGDGYTASNTLIYFYLKGLMYGNA